MNCTNAAFLYINDIMSTVSGGSKALMLDDETKPIVTVSVTRTELLENGFVVIENIETIAQKQPIQAEKSMPCACILRHTAQNVEKLIKEFSNPHFHSYHLFFTNTLPQSRLRYLAANDTGCVKTVKEYFLDYYPLNSRLFSMEIPRFSRSSEAWANRSAEGIFALLCSLRLKPVVRFDSRFDSCKKLATSLDAILEDSESQGCVHHPYEKAVVLILDRMMDPVDPLLHTLYYGSMLHDFIGINLNKVAIPNSKDTLILDERHYPKTAQYMSAWYSDASEEIHKAVKDLTSKLHAVQDQSINLADRAIMVARENETSAFTRGHFSALDYIASQISATNFQDVVAVEQDIATTNNADAIAQQIAQLINTPSVPPESALRLVCLFALRFGDSDKLSGLLSELSHKTSWRNGEVYLPDTLQRITADKKSKELFTKVSRSIFKQSEIGESKFDRWTNVLSKILTSYSEKNLSLQEFPVMGRAKPGEEIQPKLIVFYVGGTTYNEMRVASQFSASHGIDVIVGGTTVHNAASFLEQEVKPYASS